MNNFYCNKYFFSDDEEKKYCFDCEAIVKELERIKEVKENGAQETSRVQSSTTQNC